MSKPGSFWGGVKLGRRVLQRVSYKGSCNCGRAHNDYPWRITLLLSDHVQATVWTWPTLMLHHPGALAPCPRRRFLSSAPCVCVLLFTCFFINEALYFLVLMCLSIPQDLVILLVGEITTSEAALHCF